MPKSPDTFQRGRVCLLCHKPIPDGARLPDLCDKRIDRGGHRTQTTVVQVATGHSREYLEVLELTHSRVTPTGSRQWAGVGEDGRRIVWEEIDS